MESGKVNRRNERRLLWRRILTGWALFLHLVFLGRVEAQRVEAQRAEAYEYMSASSPLKNGWTVTSQSVPGRPISTVVTPAPLTPATATPTSLPGMSGNAAGVTLVPTSGQYPASAVGGTAPNQGIWPTATGANPAVGGSWVWVPNQGVGTTPGGVPVITQPTLGITSTNALKPASVPQAGGAVVPGAANCNCNPASAGMVASTVPPYTTGVPAVPFAPPSGLPGTVPTSMTQPNGTGAAGASAATTAYYPYLTGNFQPIVATKNLPPGTYMGRGMLGQPTAYVDGQPMRNLFRYVFP